MPRRSEKSPVVHVQPLDRCCNHDKKLVKKKLKNWYAWICPVKGCTVMRWKGKTATPADKETRILRGLAHRAFDPIWKGGLVTRSTAYRMLSDYMGIASGQCHIGMFHKPQLLIVFKFVHSQGRLDVEPEFVMMHKRLTRNRQ